METKTKSSYLDADSAIQKAGYADICELESEVHVPACCIYGCTTEPDGYCEHGHPSVFIEYCII